MKKIKLLLLCLPFSLLANSQAGQINQINIVSFSVKNTLPGTVDSWLTVPGALIMVAQKVQSPVPLREPRLIVQIRSGGAVICGNNIATAKQVDPFDVRTFNTADLVGLLSNCHELKEGTYSICAQFFNIDKVAISREVCKEFRVEPANVEYAPPTLITPENEKKFSQQELQGPVMFRWTPLVPKPKEPVTYRLKVWQLMQGQTGTQAIRSNQPLINKDVENLTQTTVNGILTGPCRPPYLCDFIWNVQALNRAGKPMGNNNGISEPYTFGVRQEKTNCLTNTFPEDKRKFTVKQAKEPITFKWTKTASPGEIQTYRLKVWQLMQGQTGTQAMKSNNPLITREIKNATEITVNGIYTGPCRPPYLCDFIWAVEMTDARGQASCSSEPTTFKIANNDIDIQIDSVNVECCKNGKQNIYIKLKNNLATPVKITQIKIDKVNGTTANIIPSPLTPALPFTIPGNGTQAFTGQINCIDTAKIIRFFVAAEDPVDNAITETEVEADTLHCACDACDEKHFVMNAPAPAQINTTNNSISFNQPVTIVATPPKTVKTITAELVYFEMKPENDQCIPCDKDASLYGHFTNGTNSQMWNGPQSNLNISITTPVTPCCSTLFRWCIRYKVEFSDCTVCTKVICYEKKKSGCTPTGGGGDNPTINNPK
ncbi:MAG: hypothetical protein HZB42_11565 [Sphingobacteriales bacterium]|nr:hypothetical protein [Sphingobacteriales bacterium]